MKINEGSVTAVAIAFAYFLSAALMKYIFYDNGFSFANILLLISIAYVRLHLLPNESRQLQESATLGLFLLFDKDLLDIGNLLLIIGVICIREQFHKEYIQNEVITFTCGLIFLTLGWFNVGRIFIIYFLLLFYFYTIGSVIAVTIFISLFKKGMQNLHKKLSTFSDKNTVTE